MTPGWNLASGARDLGTDFNQRLQQRAAARAANAGAWRKAALHTIPSTNLKVTHERKNPKAQ